VRDSSERDLAAHLETALRGVLLGERWPKTGVDLSITILEGEEDRWWGDEAAGGTTGVGVVAGWGMMTVLAGCVTAASAALIDAGIDCLEPVTGGTAALIRNPDAKGKRRAASGDNQGHGDLVLVLDPNPSEHEDIQAACVVAYLAQRDEVTMIWQKGPTAGLPSALMDGAVTAASAAKDVLLNALTTAASEKFPILQGENEGSG
jgi:exosome complex component MTR3